MFKIKGFLKLLFIKKLVKVQTSVLQGNKVMLGLTEAPSPLSHF